MRSLKQRLQELVPNLKVFLDVDDLKTGKGAESVNVSQNTLVMVSDGYFRSPNCLHPPPHAKLSLTANRPGKDKACH